VHTQYFYLQPWDNEALNSPFKMAWGEGVN